MARKKPQSAKNSTKIRESIHSAALRVASHTPWEFVSPLTIAEEAGITLQDLNRYYPSKADILTAIIEDLDHQVALSFSEIDEDIPMRDRLFDVLMERIDLANQDRAAHISFFKSFGWTKSGTCSDITLLMSSMRRMAECAGMDCEGIFGGARLVALALGYSWVLLTWMRDTSLDLNKTMAELDRTLGRLDSVARYVDQQV
jgi:AcrR family transcriptional regulator